MTVTLDHFIWREIKLYAVLTQNDNFGVKAEIIPEKLFLSCVTPGLNFYFDFRK